MHLAEECAFCLQPQISYHLSRDLAPLLPLERKPARTTKVTPDLVVFKLSDQLDQGLRREATK
jgi:hypothetical protein